MKAIRFLLFPFAVLYDLITSLRNVLYNKGIFTSTSFDLPVIAVGNLNVGGTGKSPQIEYLIRLLQESYKVAVLSRGYKRKTEGFVLINSNHSAEDVGDEPLQFFKKFPKISVAVDAKRVNGIQQLQTKVQPDVILLDDAFQHRKVKAGLYVLLTKYGDLYVNDFLLPTGNLRESRRGAKRANVIVVTKCPQNLSEAEKDQIQKKLKVHKNQRVFFSTISYHPKTKGHQKVPLESLKDYEIVLVTGIANPTPLLNFLHEQSCNFQHLKYPDHHHFNPQEIQEIQTVFRQFSEEKKILLTTEKDFMRLSDHISELSYIEIESTFLADSEEFNQQVLTYCNANS
jgi:tetraacyldisaccharide 4'-kinase